MRALFNVMALAVGCAACQTQPAESPPAVVVAVEPSRPTAEEVGDPRSALPRSAARIVRDPATAEALFAEARALLIEGRLAEACDKFEASSNIDPAIGTLLNVASCRERLGEKVAACRAYFEAAVLAEIAGQPQRAAIARGGATALHCGP